MVIRYRNEWRGEWYTNIKLAHGIKYITGTRVNNRWKNTH